MPFSSVSVSSENEPNVPRRGGATSIQKPETCFQIDGAKVQ